jgi:hypothetical protein
LFAILFLAVDILLISSLPGNKYIYMQVQFQLQRPYIYTLKLDLPYTNEEIVHELKSEIWSPDEAGYNQNSFPTRYRLRAVTQPRLLEIEKYIEHGDFKRQIIDTLWGTAFPGHWGVDADRIDSMTFIYGIFTKDLPGYSIRIHTDDRMHVVQGMIYFIDGDDPDQSTTVYSTQSGDNPCRIPTGHGIGYFAANTNDSWHTGHNASDQDRYSLIFGIRLNL